MDLKSIELPKIEPEELDYFLAQGWFRMHQTIFTTDRVEFNGLLYHTIWLRVCLKDFLRDKKYNALSRKNSKFKTEIKKAIVTPEHEALFTRYKESVSFEGAPSLHWLLMGHNTRNVYNTYMINIYDGSQMIGAGFFDLGNHGAAGISSIYDPDYKKYSLGKYLIYEKLLYCKNEDFQYFYPGYFVPGYPSFDYKLEIGKPAIEYFDPEKKAWFSLPQEK